MAGMVDGERRGAYVAAALRTLDWASGWPGADGAFRGAEREVDAYYFGPLAFGLAGRVKEGRRLARYIEGEFLRDGDVNDPADPGLRSAANFRNAWLCVGSQRSGDYGISYPVADRLESCQNPASGGVAVWWAEDEVERVMDMGTTAAALVAFLDTGRLEAARRAGDFLAGRLIGEQPDPAARFLLRTGWSGAWIS
ncbi:MAG: hypothetical protein QF719_06690 [Chloroflexota bacterium]|jgi:hypothetical protein|nr:hypothetical protein [Chloroflexota bacterium]MDP6757883.1 hypothetical protein [Chloroflexota bacterium]